MQSIHPRKQEQYDYQIYSQWKQLPPNLPLPTTATVQVLYLRFGKILYLHQIGQQVPYELKIQWWGIRQAHQVVLKSEEAATWAKYIVCCPLEGLLSYLSDMKVVVIEVCTRNRPIGKAYLNFLLLKGWKGELYQGYLDIKQDKKKIGEITYSIEISTITNPYFGTNSHPTLNTATAVSPAPRVNIQTNTTPRNRDSSTKNIILTGQEVPEKRQDKRTTGEILNNYFENEASDYHHSQLQESINGASEVFEVPKIKPIRQNQFNDPQPVIAREYPNYEAELVRLAEDFNLLFSKKQYEIFQGNNDNLIEIQLVGLDLPNKEINIKVLITLPLPQANKYEYRVGIGGFIKVCISSQFSRTHIVKYLKNAQVEFQTEMGLTGTVKLSKILANSGQVVEVPLLGQVKKQKLKGTCFIKAIPPSSQHPQPKQSKQMVEAPPKQIQTPDPKVQFVLFSLKSYNPLEPFNRKVNLHVKIYESVSSVLLGQTKTVWNTAEFTSFEDSVTCQTASDRFRLQLLDRQGSDIILGEGELSTPSPIGIGVEIPILAKEMGKRRSIGYLCLDFVRNGLNSVTKMISVLGKTNNSTPATNQQKQTYAYQQNRYEQNLRQKNNSKQQSKHSSNEQSFNNSSIESCTQKEAGVEPQQASTHKKQAYPRQFDRTLSQLQVYNKLFTFLYQNTSILAQIVQQSSVKITLFLQVLQPLLTKRVLSLNELNLIITKHLFSNPEAGAINKIDLNRLRDSYDAFSTYYEELVQQRDQLFNQFLEIIEAKGMSINDLEYALKNHKNMWQAIAEFVRDSKASHLNLVEEIRDYYEQSSESISKSITVQHFCDALRRFEVYQTTMGEQIQQRKLQAFIYEHLCELLVENEPDIFKYSCRQLIEYLREEQVEVSQWEMLNIAEHLKSRQRWGSSQPGKYQLPTRQYKMTEPVKKQNISELINKPTISKSPTFGYLHAPEVFKRDNHAPQNDMIQSLDVRMNNLPISPINHQNSQPPTQGLRAFFSNLAYPICQLRIDATLIDLDKLHHYVSNNQDGTYSKVQDSCENIPSKQYQSNKQEGSQVSAQFSVGRTIRSNKLGSKEKLNSYNSILADKNVEVSLSEVAKKFSYQVEVYFQEQTSPIQLQCIHEEWCSLVSDQGDYLGGMLIV